MDIDRLEFGTLCKQFRGLCEDVRAIRRLMEEQAPTAAVGETLSDEETAAGTRRIMDRFFQMGEDIAEMPRVVVKPFKATETTFSAQLTDDLKRWTDQVAAFFAAPKYDGAEIKALQEAWAEKRVSLDRTRSPLMSDEQYTACIDKAGAGHREHKQSLAEMPFDAEAPEEACDLAVYGPLALTAERCLESTSYAMQLLGIIGYEVWKTDPVVSGCPRNELAMPSVYGHLTAALGDLRECVPVAVDQKASDGPYEVHSVGGECELVACMNGEYVAAYALHSSPLRPLRFYTREEAESEAIRRGASGHNWQAVQVASST